MIEWSTMNVNEIPLNSQRFYSLCFVDTLNVFNLIFLDNILCTCPLSQVGCKHLEGGTRYWNPVE